VVLGFIERESRPNQWTKFGANEGGTLFLWTRVAADDAHLVAIDTRHAPLPLSATAASWHSTTSAPRMRRA